MSRVYKESKSEYWYADYIDYRGKRIRRSTGTKNKRAAQEILSEWLTQSSEIKAGRRAGSIDGRPIKEHFSDYERARAIQSRVNSGEAAYETTRRWLDRLASHCNWAVLRDICREDVEAYAEHLKDLGRSNRNIHQMIGAVRAFCRWCVKTRKMDSDPTAAIAKPSLTQRAFSRRMLMPEEWRWLKESLKQPSQKNGQSSHERMVMYWLTIETGLRATEVVQLAWSDVSLGKLPFVSVAASATKNNKPAKQYVSDELAEELKKMKGTRKVFSISSKQELARTFRSDVDEARLLWLDSGESLPADFLESPDASGAVLDFHSLRHTCGSWLVAEGIPLPEVQKIMRHSTIKLTVDTYGHIAPDTQSQRRNALSARLR